MTGRRRIAGDDAMDALVAVVGQEAAGALARHFGGTRLYVPRTIGEHHPIGVAIGQTAAGRLASEYAGQSVEIPRQPERRARVLALRSRALTVVEIARQTTYSERHVRRLLAEHEADRHPDLFDAP